MYKKLILTIIAVLACALLCNAAAQVPGKAVPRDEVKALVEKYGKANPDKFNGHYINKFWLKTLLKLSGSKSKNKDAKSGSDDDVVSDKEAAEIVKSMDKLEGMLIAEYTDCSAAVKEDFNKKLTALLDGVNLLTQSTKEDEKTHKMQTVLIYGSDNGDTIKDLLIYGPEECILMGFFGEMKKADKEAQ